MEPFRTKSQSDIVLRDKKISVLHLPPERSTMILKSVARIVLTHIFEVSLLLNAPIVCVWDRRLLI